MNIFLNILVFSLREKTVFKIFLKEIINIKYFKFQLIKLEITVEI